MKNMRLKIIGFIATVLVCLSVSVSASALSVLDMASYQAGLATSESGAELIWVKATEGIGYVNPDCDRAVQESLSAGLGVGVYDFAHSENDPIDEADYFLDHTIGYRDKGVLPILDWEPNNPGNVDWVKRWCDRVYRVWGVKPLVYMNISTENNYNWATVVSGDYGLWIAGGIYYNKVYNINDKAPTPYFTLRNWPFVVAWQYTSNGRVNGWNGAVDLSEFYGDYETYNKYARSTIVKKESAKDVPAVGVTVKPTANECRVIQTDQYVTMFWPDWWNVKVPSGNASLVYPGDVVCHKGTLERGNATRSVIVRSGDTLFGIADRLGISWLTLRGYSSGNPNLIYPGEVLTY